MELTQRKIDRKRGRESESGKWYGDQPFGLLRFHRKFCAHCVTGACVLKFMGTVKPNGIVLIIKNKIKQQTKSETEKKSLSLKSCEAIQFVSV